MPMTSASAKAKIKAAYQSRTGNTMTDGDFEAIVDVCEGIIQELIANMVIQSAGTCIVSGGSSSGSHPVTVTSTVIS
jgi:hypothetical protein